VGNVSVSLVMGRGVIQHDTSKVSAATIRDMIEDRGFDAEVLFSDTPQSTSSDSDEDLLASEDEEVEASQLTTTTLSISGMTCGSCVSAIEGAFKTVSGIKSFSISLLSERAVIEHDPNLITHTTIINTIEDTGFDAKLVDSSTSSLYPKHRKSRRRRSVAKQDILTTTVAITGMTCVSYPIHPAASPVYESSETCSDPSNAHLWRWQEENACPGILFD
jgi:Cu+-exporting ATPase